MWFRLSLGQGLYFCPQIAFLIIIPLSEPAKFGSIWEGQPELLLWQCGGQCQHQGGPAAGAIHWPHPPAPPSAGAHQPPRHHQQQPCSGGTGPVRWAPAVIFQYWNGISGQSGDHYKEVVMSYFTCNTTLQWHYFTATYCSYDPEGHLLHAAHPRKLQHGPLQQQQVLKKRRLNTLADQDHFRVYTNSSSPGPADSGLYNGHTGHNADNSGYVTANSPQPNTFPAIPINRVSNLCFYFIKYS